MKAAPLIKSIPEVSWDTYSQVPSVDRELGPSRSLMMAVLLPQRGPLLSGVCSNEEFSKTKISFCEFPVNFLSS